MSNSAPSRPRTPTGPNELRLDAIRKREELTNALNAFEDRVRAGVVATAVLAGLATAGWVAYRVLRARPAPRRHQPWWTASRNG